MANEKINVEIAGKYDDKAAKEAIADAKQIEKLDPTLTIDGDNAEAMAKTDEVAEATGRLSKDDTVVTITAKIDDAKAQIEALQTKLHEVDDETVSPEVDTTGIDRITESSGKAQGAVHSMAGEAITELPGIGDAVGPAGEAIGQLTEGLLAGEIAMGDLVAAAGPLIGLTVAFKVISGFMAKMAESKAFHNDEVAAWVKLIEQGKRSVDDIADRFVALGEVKFDALGGIFKGDLTGLLAKAGLSVDDFATIVKGGSTALQQWADDAEAAGINVDTIDGILIGASGIVDDYAEGIQNATLMAKFHGEAMEGEAHGLANTVEPQKKMTQAVKDSIKPLDDAAAKTKELEEGYGRLQDRLSKTRAIEDFQNAMVEAQKTIAEKGQLTQDELRGVEDSIISAGEAADLNPIDVQAAIDELSPTDVNNSFIKMQSDIDAKGPLRVNVALHATIGKLKLGGRGGTTIVVETDQSGGQGLQFARGGSVLVGEHGPEAVKLPAGAQVIPNHQLNQFGAAAPTTVNVNLPRGVRALDIAKAVGVSARRNGTKFANPVVSYAK